MSVKWLIGLGVLFIVGSVIANIIDYIAPIGDPSAVGGGSYYLFSAISTWSTVEINNPLTWSGAFVGLGQLMIALWAMFLWEYNFLAPEAGNWYLLKWLILYPISFRLIIVFLLSLIRGVSST